MTKMANERTQIGEMSKYIANTVILPKILNLVVSFE
jgi:hypothetical protein